MRQTKNIQSLNSLRQRLASPVDGVSRPVLQPVLQNLLQHFLCAVFVLFALARSKTTLHVLLHCLWPVLGSGHRHFSLIIITQWGNCSRHSPSKKKKEPKLKEKISCSHLVWAPPGAGVAVAGEEGGGFCPEGCSPGGKAWLVSGPHWTWYGLFGILNFITEVPGASVDKRFLKQN